MVKEEALKCYMKFCCKFGSVNVGVACIDFLFLNAIILGMKEKHL